MKLDRWQIRFTSILLAVALVFYALRWILFANAGLHNEMVRFLVGDIAFLFVQVPLVSLVIDRNIQRREREEMLHKLNMIIGVFFSETGDELLGLIASADAKLPEVRDDLTPDSTWTAQSYEDAKATFAAHSPVIDLSGCDLDKLNETLARERSFMIGLLSNQNLLENDAFADLLWAITHVGEELAARPDLHALSLPDAAHIAMDVKRAYKLLGTEWLSFMRHLQHDYPYLFSLAVRTNPLDPDARAVVSS